MYIPALLVLRAGYILTPEEMAELVKAKRKTRGGHKAYVTQILPEAKELVATGHCTPGPETRPRFTKLKASLEEQLTSL